MGDVKFADNNNDSQCFQISKYNYYKLRIFTPQEEVHSGEVFIMGQLSGRKDRIISEFLRHYIASLVGNCLTCECSVITE